MLPELRRVYGLTASEIDGMPGGELAVFVEHLAALMKG